jgi:hypothetical protein
MSKRDDELTPRPGRIRDKSFVGQVMRAAKKAGRSGKRFGGGSRRGTGSSSGRGRRAATSLSLRSTSRRVVMMARVVRHQGTHFRSTSLANHISYLRREGVTRDGGDARMANEKDFAERAAQERQPCGRPKSIAVLRDLAQAEIEANIRVLVMIRDSKRAPAAARIAAIRELLDRRYGKAAQPVAGDPGAPVIFQIINRPTRGNPLPPRR